MSWIIEKLFDSETLIIVLTAFNHDGSKNDCYDMESIIKSDTFSSILIKDLNNKWYTGPIEGVGNNYLEVVEYLKKISLRYKRVLVIGDSMAGYGAILYGTLINATQVISFSPQTMIDNQNNKLISDDRYLNWFEKLHSLPEHFYDLRKFLKIETKETIYHVYSSENDIKDIFHAKNIEYCKNLFLHKVPMFDHWLASQFRKYGILRHIISSFLINVDSDYKSTIENFISCINSILLTEEYLFNNGKVDYVSIINNSYKIDSRLIFNKVGITHEVYPTCEINNVSIYNSSLHDKINNKGFLSIIDTMQVNHFFSDIVIVRHLTYEGEKITNLGILPKYNKFSFSDFRSTENINKSYVKDISHLYKEFTNKDWCNECILSGPYMDIEEGDYIAEIDLTGELKDKSSLVIDVCENWGSIRARKWFSRLENNFSIKLHFVSSRLMQHSEIRLFAEGSFSGHVSQVRLSKILTV